jgi:hypothetical protein
MIEPLVDYSRARLGSIPAIAWYQPYLLGFMTMLISLAARLELPAGLTSDQLGLVQLDAWRQITGLEDDMLGEQICLLSASGDEAFASGCANALSFVCSYMGAPLPADLSESALEPEVESQLYHDDLVTDDIGIFAGAEATATLWHRYFEHHVRAAG